MAVYLKKFETQSAYEAAQSSLILPNVSLTVDNNTVHYNASSPTPPTPTETRVVCKYNVEDTEYETQLCYGTTNIGAMEIDGVELPTVVTAYTFSTTGEHTVKYTLTDPTTIGDEVLRDCYSLTSISIPNSVISIGDYAFTNSPISSCTIGNGVTSIGTSAFDSCTSLTSINIPSSVTSIGENAFYSCAFTSIAIPDSVTSIGGSAFNNCSSLESVTIGSGVTSIGDSVFEYDENLISFTILAPTPPIIGSSVFGYFGSGFAIYVPSGSVNAYKADSYWSSFEDFIEPIQ